jgi:CRISPR/Cas system-associated exonuclease Cas4 (RecB family)
MIDFNHMIDDFLEREQRQKTIGRYYPSEIGTCIRKVWYSYKFPTEIEPRLIRIFEVGNIMHDFVVKVLQSEKVPEVDLIQSEFPFKEAIEDFIISGRIDNLILIKSSGKNVLVEVKSTGNIDYINEAKSENISQLQLYMHYLKSKWKISDGILLYVNKNDLTSKVFTVKYDEKEALKIINRFKALHKMLVNNITPKPEARENKKTIWMCNFCEYREKCYKETPSSPEFL